MTISHILATRPEPQQSELLEALSHLGPEVVSMPALNMAGGKALPDAPQLQAPMAGTRSMPFLMRQWCAAIRHRGACWALALQVGIS